MGSHNNTSVKKKLREGRKAEKRAGKQRERERRARDRDNQPAAAAAPSPQGG